jgi:hypothetical protein
MATIFKYKSIEVTITRNSSGYYRWGYEALIQGEIIKQGGFATSNKTCINRIKRHARECIDKELSYHHNPTTTHTRNHF